MEISLVEHPTQSTEHSTQLTQVQVIRRSTIPISSEQPADNRQFHQHALLKQFLPPVDKLAFAWITVAQHQTVAFAGTTTATAFIVCRGQAKLLYHDKEIVISTGDTVLIPPQHAYHILDVTTSELQAIALQFPEQKSEQSPFAPTYEGLMAHNEALLQHTLKNPCFATLQNSTALTDITARQKFLDSVQLFSNFFQHMLFLRQATCQDNRYQDMFTQHLCEEFGHDKLLAQRSIKHDCHDPILHAISIWFCNQMLILDNLEKTALVHLVLELGSAHFNHLAGARLSQDVHSDYYDRHEIDDAHAQMGAELLRGHQTETYRRLHQVIEKGWSMVDAMTRRFMQLATQSFEEFSTTTASFTSTNKSKNPITIVARDDIPALYSVEHEGKIHHIGKLQDFHWQETLKNFMPPAAEFSISWVSLQANEIVEPHVHPTQSMIIFYLGSGRMLGQKPQPLHAGDIVIVPPGCEHGFGGGSERLEGFSIQFSHGLYTNPNNPRVAFSEDQTQVHHLRQYHEQRLQQFSQHPLLTSLSNAVQNPQQLHCLLTCMHLWNHHINTLPFARDDYDKNTTQPIFDPILEALIDWFPYQMLVLDRAEKTLLINWVIADAKDTYHRLVRTQVSDGSYQLHFQHHWAIDLKNNTLNAHYLHHLSLETYQRLKEVLVQAWNNFTAMCDRMYVIIQEESL